MLKKFSLFALTLLLLAALNVPLAAAEKPYLEVQVNGDGSVTFFTRGAENVDWNINDDALRIYKQGDEIQLNPGDPAPIFSMLIVGTFESGKTYPYETVTNPEAAIGMWGTRLEELVDGANTPFKPGKYCAVAVGDGRFLTDPVEFEIKEWERTLQVEASADGTVSFATKGFFSGSSEVRVYKQGDACDPAANNGVILEFPISYQCNTNITYPNAQGMVECLRKEETVNEYVTDAPLKSGSYYAVVVDFDKDTLLSEPVEFEIPETQPSLRIEVSEDGTITGTTTGYFDLNNRTEVQIYKADEAYDPAAATNRPILKWRVPHQYENTETYPGSGHVGCLRQEELSAGSRSPLKGGRYLAVVVDTDAKTVVVEPVTFEVPGETEDNESTAAPAPTAESSAEPADRENGANGDTILYLCIGAAVLVVAIAVIVFAVKRKSK